MSNVLLNSLWGENFKEELSTKELIEKLNNKEIKVETMIKSKKVSTKEKMQVIEIDVHRILGGYSQNTIVLKSPD